MNKGYASRSSRPLHEGSHPLLGPQVVMIRKSTQRNEPSRRQYHNSVDVRLYTRVVALRRAGWDDFFIALSLANAPVCPSLVQVAVSYGLGRHLSDIPDAYWQVQAIKYTVIAPNFSVISTTTGKMGVTIFLLRLMGQAASAPRRWFLYIMNAVSMA